MWSEVLFLCSCVAERGVEDKAKTLSTPLLTLDWK